MATILVLHGPNMALKGVDDIDEALELRASALGVELSTVQSNAESGLVDELIEQRFDVEAVLVNPGVAAPSMSVLAEALSLVDRPAVEVLLAPLPGGQVSALAGVVRHQLHDRGKDGYVAGLEVLVKLLGVTPPAEGDEAQDEEAPGRPGLRAAPPRVAKTIGRKAPAADTTAPAVAKTLGRRSDGATSRGGEGTSPASGLTRELVRGKVSARLAGQLGADELASWARTEWAGLQKGGPHEPGAKDVLETVLLTLMSGTKASEHVLLAQLARLES